jgi:glycosyltransferase involved in cell wall biosynthesis
MINSTLIRITTVPISLKILLKGQHRYIAENGYDVLAVSAKGKELQEVAQNENIRVQAVEMTRKITPLRDLKSVWDLYKLFKKEKPLIVHTHTPKAGFTGMIAALLAGVPIRMHTVAGLPLLEAKGIKRKILNIVEKITYSCATKVYPNSLALKKIILKEKFCKPQKLKIISKGSSNGIDITFFNKNQIANATIESLKKQLNINANDFVFIFVGRLVSDKGINELIEAFSKLNNQNVKLLLVGHKETKLDPLQTKTLNEIKQNTSIISVGFQADVRPYFAISNVLVFPSFREGFPNVVMQAGAMGLPSIVSDINGCNEIIIDNHNGMIIQVKNTVAIYMAMKKMIENPVLYEQLKQNSRKRIIENYKQEVVWKAILKEYKSLEKKYVKPF